ncbi:hypothetical protein B566_EDAN011765 [Ephemera danica]|nr:hypothetical protein B566_EDAN011765 [Ephemera danica]
MSSSSSDDKSCKICKQIPGKYVCPRCNVLYCSVTCYRSEEHSSCSEEFYRHCVQEELLLSSHGDAEVENPKAMLEILQRMHQEEAPLDEEEDLEEADSDDSSGEGGEDLAARLAGVNLDDADSVWEKLSHEEREQFQQLLTSGEDHKADLSFMDQCPKHRTDIPALADPSRASPAVRHGLENAVLSYVLLTRFYAGDHLGELQHEAAQTLMQLSSSLSRGQNFIDRETALAAVTLEATQNLGMSQENLILGREDLENVMQGPGEEFPSYFLISTLSDSISLLSTSDRRATASSGGGGEFSRRFAQPSQVASKWSRKQMALAVKKLEFYVAWSKCQ